MPAMIEVMPAAAEHYDGWRVLWDLYCDGEVTEEVTAETWQRIINPAASITSLVAVESGKIVGLVTLVMHEGMQGVKPIYYLEGLYIAKSHRKARCDVGMAMAAAVLAKLEEGECGITRADNALAQRLYRYFEKGDPYIRYVIRKTA